MNEILTLETYIGQPRGIKQLHTWIDRALFDHRIMPHTLLTGPPGFGKTSCARMVAAELTDAPPLQMDLSRMNPKQLSHVLLNSQATVVILDEVHRAKAAQQDMLLEILSEGAITMQYAGVWRLDPPKTFIGCTTHPEKLDPAFARRFPIKIDSEPYTPEDMINVIMQKAEMIGVTIPPEHVEGLAKATLGIPSTGYDLVVAYSALGDGATVEDALELANIEPDGLTRQHLRYLDALKDLGGQAGQQGLGKLLRIHPTILSEIQRVLWERKLIQFSPGGMILLPTAQKRLSARSN